MGEGRGNRAKEQENGRLDPLMHVEQRSVVLFSAEWYVVTDTTKVCTAVSMQCHARHCAAMACNRLDALSVQSRAPCILTLISTPTTLIRRCLQGHDLPRPTWPQADAHKASNLITARKTD